MQVDIKRRHHQKRRTETNCWLSKPVLLNPLLIRVTLEAKAKKQNVTSQKLPHARRTRCHYKTTPTITTTTTTTTREARLTAAQPPKCPSSTQAPQQRRHVQLLDWKQFFLKDPWRHFIATAVKLVENSDVLTLTGNNQNLF